MTSIRTIRKLDLLPGQVPPRQARIVNGVQIDSDVPVRVTRGRRGCLVELLEALEIGESFVWAHAAENARASKRIRRSGRIFTSAREPDGKFRIWRIR